RSRSLSSFFANEPATSDIYTLSLHDALPIWSFAPSVGYAERMRTRALPGQAARTAGGKSAPAATPAATARWTILATNRLAVAAGDRKSTRLNSSHVSISYAVFCLKKKNNHKT